MGGLVSCLSPRIDRQVGDTRTFVYHSHGTTISTKFCTLGALGALCSIEYSTYIPEYDMRVIHMKTAVIVWFLFLYYLALLHGGSSVPVL